MKIPIKTRRIQKYRGMRILSIDGLLEIRDPRYCATWGWAKDMKEARTLIDARILRMTDPPSEK